MIRIPPHWQAEIDAGTEFGLKAKASLESAALKAETGPQRTAGPQRRSCSTKRGKCTDCSNAGTLLMEAIQADTGQAVSCGSCKAYLLSLDRMSSHDHAAIVQKLYAEIAWPQSWRATHGDKDGQRKRIGEIVSGVLAVAATTCKVARPAGVPGVRASRNPYGGSWLRKQLQRIESLKQAAIDFWQDGMELATKEQQQSRLSVCRSCPLFNDGWCDKDRGGCGCNLELKVKARAAFCPAQKWHAHGDNYRPLTSPTRNLLFHIFPRLGAEWNWHKHIERIREHQHLFNGKICIGVVTGPGLASHEEVQRLMGGIRVTDWVLRENSKLGETVTMTELLRLVQTDDPNTITFRGHCKGVTHSKDGIEQAWAEMMWAACVDIESVEDALASHEMAGPLKCHEPLVPKKNSNWFFAGSFYWFRNREIFQRQWDYTGQNRWVIEAWPEIVCQSDKAACLFFDQMDRQILRHWETIQAEYKIWKAAREVTIPVFVNVFNRLTTTRNLCEQLAAMPNVRVVIVDNASTYPPLLDWYAECPHEVVRLESNMGHHAPWLSGTVSRIATNGHYCVTDCDLDLEGVPLDLMDVLRAPLVSCVAGVCGVKKSGISLRIDDLPEWQSEVVNWEKRFWEKPIGGRYYQAIIDTTLCMYSASLLHRHAMTIGGIKTVRSAMPYTARHMPWYLDCENLDKENQQYFETANQSNSWKPQGKALASRFAH